MKKPHRKKNIDAKGRSIYSEDKFLLLPYSLLSHPHFRILKGNSTKVLFEICRRHNGFNNGKIAMSYDQMVEELNISKTTAVRACEELEYYEFIKLRKLGSYIGHKANEWEVTFLKSEEFTPKNEWKNPKKIKPKRKRKNSVNSVVDNVLNSQESLDQRLKKRNLEYLNEQNDPL